LQTDLSLATKQKLQLQDQNRTMEGTIARKEKDISDLLTKVNDTIKEYETKLERKEEQMWAMNEKLSEGQTCASTAVKTTYLKRRILRRVAKT
jgi:uncharacterized coiled-coil protein SlyX